MLGPAGPAAAGYLAAGSTRPGPREGLMTMTDEAPAARAHADQTGRAQGDQDPAGTAVIAAGQAASQAAGSLRHAPDDGLDEVLRMIAARLAERARVILAANEQDVQAARAGRLAAAFVDRLTLDDGRVKAMTDQLLALADVPAGERMTRIRDLPDGLELHERRRPVGVIGANFEARPNVVVDIASQLIKSRNAGVLRTGSSAIRSAAVLTDEVIGPAMQAGGLDPAAIQLLRVPGRESAE